MTALELAIKQTYSQESKETKRCCHCKKTFPVDDFGSDRNRTDGKNPQCKICANRDYARYREASINMFSVDGYECKLSDSDSAWLAGIIDGEGCISIKTRKRDGKNPETIFDISIVNTDQGIINEIKRILDEIKIVFYNGVRGVGSGRRTKPLDVIEIRGMARTKVVLLEVHRYLRSTKKDTAKIILDYVPQRIHRHAAGMPS